MPLSPEVMQRARTRVGTVLAGKYRLNRMLGLGGMAAVYEAVHRNNKRVAVKILHTELSVDDTIRTRFLREGYAANTVDHPGAVAIFDDDVAEDGSAFLVMELLTGETLEDRADRLGGKLPEEEVLKVTDQLLDVLEAAHAKGIVHRDVKPENLFLTTTGQLKVLDFGIARLRELTGPSQEATGVGSFMGTPGFMSPEQALGKWDQVDARSDIWAIGATMFMLLTARCVHEGESAAEVLVKAATERAPAIDSIVPEVTPAVARIVDQALVYEKGARWQDVLSMRTALREAIGWVGAVDLSVPVPQRPSMPVGHDAETLVAEHVSDITDRQRVSQPENVMSRTTSVSVPARRGYGVLVIAAALAAIVVGVVAFAAGNASDTSPPGEPMGNAPAAAPLANQVGTVNPTAPQPDQPIVVPVPTPSEALTPEPEPSASTKSPKRKWVGPVKPGTVMRPPAPSARPPAEGSPSSGALPPTPRPAASPRPAVGDPLEKRY